MKIVITLPLYSQVFVEASLENLYRVALTTDEDREIKVKVLTRFEILNFLKESF